MEAILHRLSFLTAGILIACRASNIPPCRKHCSTLALGCFQGVGFLYGQHVLGIMPGKGRYFKDLHVES